MSSGQQEDIRRGVDGCQETPELHQQLRGISETRSVQGGAQRVHFSCTCFSCILLLLTATTVHEQPLIGVQTFQHVDAHWKSYVISSSKGMCPTNSAVQWLKPDHTHTHLRYKLFNTQSWANLLWLFEFFPRWVNKPWWSSQDQSGTCLVFARGKDRGINTACSQLRPF